MVGFGAVGLVGVTCDIATFNLVIGVFHGPKVYGSLSGTALGTLIGYLGNRYWVFRHRDRRQSTTEITLFLLVSAVGMLITAGCVAFNEYVLGYHSLLAANVAQFIVGQGLGTVFRFWAMHLWVFPEAREVAADGEDGPDALPRPDEPGAVAAMQHQL
jgi:putative flippase GtrA